MKLTQGNIRLWLCRAISNLFLISLLVVLLAAGLGAATAQATPINLIANGSFEQGTSPGSFTTLSPGSTAITGWTIVSGTVDYIGTYWKAADGSRSLDMNGTSQGTIASTSFATTPGYSYLVTFDMAGNPDKPNDKTMTVSAAGASQSYIFRQDGYTKTNMGWTPEVFTFTATAQKTTLQFQGGAANGSWGPALDNIVAVVAAVPLPSTWLLLGSGIIGLWGLGRRRKWKTVA